jgi:hypothetical protein
MAHRTAPTQLGIQEHECQHLRDELSAIDANFAHLSQVCRVCNDHKEQSRGVDIVALAFAAPGSGQQKSSESVEQAAGARVRTGRTPTA